MTKKSDARSRLQFDVTASNNYLARQAREREAKIMNRMKPKLIAAAVAVTTTIAGSEYTKGVRNGKD